jgi:galactokinase
MTGMSCASALVECGLDPREHQAKARLFERVLDVCPEADQACWVPGRLEVFGKHTDYAGGRTLTAALPKGFACAARGRSGRLVRVVDAREKETATVDPAERGGPGSGWRHYIDVVVRRLTKNFPGAPLGAEIAFASDLPPAAGMSSSSALVVAVAKALVELAGIDHLPAWRQHIATPLDAASYFACIENGSRFGALAGDAGVGTHGGSEDHATMLAAEAGRLTAFAFVPACPLGVAPLPHDWRFVIAESGIVAEKTGTARDAYNRLSEGVRVLLDVWNAQESAAASLAAALDTASDAVDRLREHVARARIPDWTATSLTRRLDHFVREDGRVETALDAFRRADRHALDELSSASQADAESLLGNQVEATVALAGAARDRGAFAACSFGAGFGGSVWALVRADKADGFAARWHPSAFVARPGPPLTRLGSGL